MFSGAFLLHFGGLGVPFGLILVVLAPFWVSFWVSWGLLGRPFDPSWPKLAQDNEKSRFVQRQPRQQCAKRSSENRALFFEMPPSLKILECNWMWPGQAGLVNPSF